VCFFSRFFCSLYAWSFIKLRAMYVTAVGAGAAGVAAARPPSALAVGPQSAASNRHSGASKAFCVDVSVLLPHWHGLRIVGPGLQSRCKAQGQKCVWNNPFVTVRIFRCPFGFFLSLSLCLPLSIRTLIGLALL
jgi:hypothetical protein